MLTHSSEMIFNPSQYTAIDVNSSRSMGGDRIYPRVLNRLAVHLHVLISIMFDSSFFTQHFFLSISNDAQYSELDFFILEFFFV